MQEDWFKQQPEPLSHHPCIHAGEFKRARSTLTMDFLTFMGLSWNFNVLLMLSSGAGIQNVSSRDMMGLKDLESVYIGS